MFLQSIVGSRYDPAGKLRLVDLPQLIADYAVPLREFKKNAPDTLTLA